MGGGATHWLRRHFTPKFVGICVTVGVLIRQNISVLPHRVEIKDVRLPHELQRAMAAEAEATREARAKVIAAEGEFQASTALKEASMVISESPAALQLRYLQTLTTISAEKNSTILFPLPIDLLSQFMKK